MIFRIYYSNGFWADEWAKNKKEAVDKAEVIAAHHGVKVERIDPVR